MNNNCKKKDQLGVPFGTAQNRLRKKIMFSLIKKCNLDTCYRCGEEIADTGDLSIEHKEAWMDSDNPAWMFFDLDNIAFSHLKCNIAHGRRPHKRLHN